MLHCCIDAMHEKEIIYAYILGNVLKTMQPAEPRQDHRHIL